MTTNTQDIATRITRAAQVLGNRIDIGTPMSDTRRECVQAIADLNEVAEELRRPSPAPVAPEVLNYRPQIASMEMGPEPSLSEMVRSYYATHIDDTALVERFHSEYIAALSHSAAAPSGGGWRPISEQDKDGREVLLGWRALDGQQMMIPAQRDGSEWVIPSGQVLTDDFVARFHVLVIDIPDVPAPPAPQTGEG